jgi:ABC-type amino acid transport substrate-binding protein
MAKRILLLLLIAFINPAFADGVLRVGLSADYPPLHYKQEGKIVGLEVDNATAVAKILGRKLVLFEYSFLELATALEQGRIDAIMSGISVTEERAKTISFADPYMEVGQMAIFHTEKIGSFAQPRAIYRKNIRVGVEPGTTGASFAKKELPDAKITFFVDPAAAFYALRDDTLDVYIHDAPTSWHLASSADFDDLISTYKLLTTESLAWAVAPGNTELLTELNRALRMMKSQGTLDYIINRWIPVRVSVQ